MTVWGCIFCQCPDHCRLLIFRTFLLKHLWNDLRLQYFKVRLQAVEERILALGRMPPFNQIFKPNCRSQSSKYTKNAQVSLVSPFPGFPCLEGAVLAPAALARLCVWMNSTCVARRPSNPPIKKNNMIKHDKRCFAFVFSSIFFQIIFAYCSHLSTSHPTESHHPAATACQEISPDIPKDQQYGKDCLYPTTQWCS